MGDFRITADDDPATRQLYIRTVTFAAKELLEDGHPPVEITANGYQHHGTLTHAGNGHITVDTYAGEQNLTIADITSFRAP